MIHLNASFDVTAYVIHVSFNAGGEEMRSTLVITNTRLEDNSISVRG